MGREVKRVATNFRWYEEHRREIWWGYGLDQLECGHCGGTGKGAEGRAGFPRGDGSFFEYESRDCPLCEGEGRATPKIEPPSGPGWQMWETTSEGSPISPVFDTPEALARWLADTGASAFGSDTATYEQWLSTINRGSAPSAVFTAEHGLQSGVAGLTGPEGEE